MSRTGFAAGAYIAESRVDDAGVAGAAGVSTLAAGAEGEGCGADGARRAAWAATREGGDLRTRALAGGSAFGTIASSGSGRGVARTAVRGLVSCSGAPGTTSAASGAGGETCSTAMATTEDAGIGDVVPPAACGDQPPDDRRTNATAVTAPQEAANANRPAPPPLPDSRAEGRSMAADGDVTRGFSPATGPGSGVAASVGARESGANRAAHVMLGTAGVVASPSHAAVDGASPADP